MFPRNSDVTVQDSFSDQLGRLLVLQIEKDGCEFTLGNIYAPTQDHVQDQVNLMDVLEEHISSSSPHNIILGGDFNLCRNVDLDRLGSTHNSSIAEGARYPARIEAMNNSLHLFDVWRKIKPSTKQFSFKRGHSASRLDYWLASEHMFNSETASDIIPCPLSDHSAITISVGERPSRKGPGLWRLDNVLIENKVFREAIYLLFQEEASNTDPTDPTTHWDWIKFRIKSTAIKISKDLRAQGMQHEKSITAEYMRLRGLADQGEEYDPCSLQSLERELRELELSKAARDIERTKTCWAM